MATSYREAPEVTRIAQRLIPEHHQDLELRMDEIRCVFRSDIPLSAGRAVLGRARKIGGLNCYLATAEHGAQNTFKDSDDLRDMFVIEISEPAWENLTPAGHEALVDHELCHFTMKFDDRTGKIKRGIRGHSVEEFTEILARRGLWKQDLKTFAEHIPSDQLQLLAKED